MISGERLYPKFIKKGLTGGYKFIKYKVQYIKYVVTLDLTAYLYGGGKPAGEGGAERRGSRFVEIIFPGGV